MNNRAESIRVMHPLFQEGEGGPTPTSALQMRVEPCPLTMAMELNAKWHSVLPKTHFANLKAGFHSICYAAEFNGITYAVSIWSDPVNRSLCDGKTIELRRLAIAPDAPKNTASRMLSIMTRLLAKRFPELARAVSYQAVDVHRGTIYKAAGWTQTVFVKFTPWDRKTAGKRGRRRDPQTKSDKQRWEKELS